MPRREYTGRTTNLPLNLSAAQRHSSATPWIMKSRLYGYHCHVQLRAKSTTVSTHNSMIVRPKIAI